MILVALGVGTALVTTEVSAEGAPDREAFVMLGIKRAEVLLGYFLFRQFVRVFRSKSSGRGHLGPVDNPGHLAA